MISAASTAQPPRSAEGKRIVATLGPTTRRTMWGMAKPTKAMGPVAAVALLYPDRLFDLPRERRVHRRRHRADLGDADAGRWRRRAAAPRAR